MILNPKYSTNMKKNPAPAALGALALAAALLPLPPAYAQPSAAKPPGIYISEFEVTDPGGIRPYSAAVDATFAPFGGRYAVRGGQVTSLEGDPTKRVVSTIESPAHASASLRLAGMNGIRPCS